MHKGAVIQRPFCVLSIWPKLLLYEFAVGYEFTPVVYDIIEIHSRRCRRHMHLEQVSAAGKLSRVAVVDRFADHVLDLYCQLSPVRLSHLDIEYIDHWIGENIYQFPFPELVGE